MKTTGRKMKYESELKVIRSVLASTGDGDIDTCMIAYPL